jgi:peroxiredoxin
MERSMALEVGDVVGDFSFVRMDGADARLSDFKDPVLILIFLRHLA